MATNLLHEHWQLQLPELVGRLQAATARLQKPLEGPPNQQGGYYQALQEEGWLCQDITCGGRCTLLEGVAGIRQSIQCRVVDILGSFEITLQAGRCATCGCQQYPGALDLLCWPATPIQASVLYTLALMEQSYHHRFTSPVSISSWTEAQQRMQERFAGCKGDANLWANFGTALEKYAYCRQTGDSLSVLGVSPIAEKYTFGCPCCWRQCVAACADACLGLTRMRKSAVAQEGRERLFTDHLFVRDEVVMRHQDAAKQRPLPQRSQEDCSEFKAAQAVGRRSKYYDVHGTP